MVPASVLLVLLFLQVFLADVPVGVGALSLSRSHTSNGRLSFHRVRTNKAPTALFEDPFLFEEKPRSSHVPHKTLSHKAKAKDLNPFGILSDSTTPDASTVTPKSDKTSKDPSSTEEESKHTTTKLASDTTELSANAEPTNSVPATQNSAPLLAAATSTSSSSFSFSGTMPGPIATSLPSGSVSSTDGSDAKASGGIGASNWRVVGIGVLVVGGIGITVAGFTFFDCWWAFVSKPCGGRRKRKFDHLGDEELLPDWNRGSWRVGLEEQRDWLPKSSMSPDAASIVAFEEQGATKEKSNFITLPPPRPPFTLRRSPDTSTTLVNASSNASSSTTSLSEKSPNASYLKPTTPPMARISRKAPESLVGTDFPITTPSMTQKDASTVKKRKSGDKKKLRKSTSAPNFGRQSRLFLINPDEAEAYGGLAGLESPASPP